MVTEEELILKTKKLIEIKLGWGDSLSWTNQDFLELSKKIQDEIKVAVSHVTLKRIWGKVKYESLPNTFTLNTLVQFIGYENWRDFRVKNGGNPIEVIPEPLTKDATFFARHKRTIYCIGVIFNIVVVLTFYIRLLNRKPIPSLSDGYTFSARKTLEKGVPNSVIFDYDATRAPEDSVIIQQSWDVNRRKKVSKAGHRSTLIYYLPGFFVAKLIIAGKVLKEQGILIESDGWLAAIDDSPIPVYFKKEDYLVNGRMTLPAKKIESQNISLSPQAPFVSYLNVQDFGPIYSDDFVFETSVRSDYKEGSSKCQKTNIYLLCEGYAIGIPLGNVGCVSDMSLMFSGFNAPGKETDLSAFGVDFNQYVKVRIEADRHQAKIFLNGKLSYEIKRGIVRSKIIGIDFVFQGTGSVEYVKLSNEKVKFQDDF